MMEDALQDSDSKENFRRAKIEHFVEKAEAFVQMGRFGEARRTIDRVTRLDPGNDTARLLRKTLEERFRAMSERQNGSGEGTQGSGAKPRRHEVVLVVDQDERLLLELAVSLSRSGFQVVGAGTYDEAIEALGTMKPDIVISEVNFENGPKGFDLYLQLRTNSAFMDTPFMFLATRVDRDTLIAGKRFGVDDFVVKPADSEVITASIINCLARRKQVHRQM